MPKQKFRTYRQNQPDPFGVGEFCRIRGHFSWRQNDKIGGKLILKSSPHSRNTAVCLNWQARDAGSASSLNRDAPHPATTPGMALAMSRLEAESYARLRGRLYKGSASLGVTFASWRQSSDMIISRYKQLDDLANRRLAFVKLKHRLKQRITPQDIAGFHLEVIFGWTPLLADIHAAATSIIDARPQSFWVRGNARTTVEHRQGNPSTATSLQFYKTLVRCNRVARVEISNPNTWLKERAGLNNPAAVAWDLVPWSFVVNMFVNTGQLVNSLSDFAGLSFPDSVIVRHYRLAYTHVLTKSLSGTATYSADFKTQEPGGVQSPPLIFKVPELNLETLAMAASLFTQKFGKLKGLFS